MADDLRARWTGGRRIERVGYLVGAVLLLSGLFHLGVFAVLGGPWEGPVSWRKPVTFGLSFGLTLITIVWVTSYLPLRDRARTWLLGLFTLECAIEVAGITVQAWRHVPSHYNAVGPFNAVVVAFLASGGMVLIAVVLALTVVAQRPNPSVSPSMRLALRFGFLALLAALAVGAVMIAKGEILANSGQLELAFATGGSYKPAHAAPMHAILVLPALAWLLSFTDWPEARRLLVVRVAVGCYLVVAAAVMLATFLG
ncbi:hypothetical protein F0L68_21725 [Solihabitans fulvus]|uniref:Uncharacterized protein n=2 Tax=Solihabitans fulvus TaxID=1892852 RepID=A0A5B2X7U1_9PSEU|nr:hypothetical protein F0L68_21725 [Solihabitans fulvus]